MTLAQLKNMIPTINPQGVSVALLTNEKLEVYQQMAFDWILKLCEPLNLVVGYRDTNIYRSIGDGWFLKKPTIATEDEHFIDIDSRLDMAFVYIVVHFLGHNDVAVMKRNEAYRIVLEYAVNVNEMGYRRAKEVYEQNSFITKVKFDCYGKFYEVDEDFVKLIIDCLLCNGACMRADENHQLELYKQYLLGIVSPLDRERLRAVDESIFRYLMKNIDLVVQYSEEELGSVTTYFEELCRLGEGETVAPEIGAIDKRMLNDACCEDEMKVCRDEY